MEKFEIRGLTEADSEALYLLRKRALIEEPLAFGSSPEEDRLSSADAARELIGGLPPDDQIFGAFSPELVGIVGMIRQKRVKSRHKLNLWGMYVAPESRGLGVGYGLVKEAIAWASSTDAKMIGLSVSSESSAVRLYQRHGFQIWGTEPRARIHEGQVMDEHQMYLDLD